MGIQRSAASEAFKFIREIRRGGASTKADFVVGCRIARPEGQKLHDFLMGLKTTLQNWLVIKADQEAGKVLEKLPIASTDELAQ